MQTTAPTEASKQEISVAVYPYVPDRALFQRVLTTQWQEIEPDVSLKFVDWNCFRFYRKAYYRKRNHRNEPP